MGLVGTWVEIQNALLDVRLVGSVSDKIILLASAKPNHKKLGVNQLQEESYANRDQVDLLLSE